MAFLSNLFGAKNQDGGSLAGHLASFLALLAATPGGVEFINAAVGTMGKYALPALVLVSYLGGARAGQPKGE